MQHTEYNQDGTVKKVTNVVADADQIGDIPGAIDFESAMATDADTAFATAYYEGAKTFRSAVGDWFKTKTTALLEKLGVSRNRFNNFDSTQDAETRKQQMLDTMVEAQDDQGIDGKIDLETIEQEEYEEDGETKTRPAEADDPDHGGTQYFVHVRHCFTAGRVHLSDQPRGITAQRDPVSQGDQQRDVACRPQER